MEKDTTILSHSLTFREEPNKRYLMYYLRWIAKIGVFESLSTGIRVRSCDTNWNKLRELPYIVPPIEEQDAIAKYLDGARPYNGVNMK